MTDHEFTPESLLRMNVLGCDKEFAEAYEQWFESRWRYIRNAGVRLGSGQVSLAFGLSSDDSVNDAVAELESFLPFVAEITDDNVPDVGTFRCFDIDHVAPERGLYFLYVAASQLLIARVGIGGRSTEIEATFSTASECARHIGKHLPRNL